jgi:spoIIIJ-associated protein
MKKEIEVSAKTREEAIEKAVVELGAPSAAAIMYTVINEGRKGFLGFGAVDCTIKAVYQVPDAPAEEKPRRERRDRRDSDRRDGDRRDNQKRDRAPKREERETVEAPVVEAAPEAETPVLPPVENIDPATASESEQTAYRFICKLVEDMELKDVAIGMHPGHNDDMVITVDGESAGVLIGHHGDTLDALQYLANLAANRKEEGEKREYARITVDVESYRAKREEALRILARKKAHQVLKYKKSIMLEPMNPYERRIIHSEIQHMEGVATNSIGVENNRRIVIYLEEEGMPTAGIKGKAPAEKTSSGSNSRNRNRNRRRSGNRTSDPLTGDSLTGETRKPGASIFDGEEEHDPFDIDLSAATYSEEEETAEVISAAEDTSAAPAAEQE